MQLIKHYWHYNQDQDRYEPFLKFYEPQTEKITDLKLEQGIALAWKFSEERFCPGFMDMDHYRPCPEHRKLPDLKYDLCALCEADMGFKAAFLFGQEPNERARKYLNQPHYIYLAHFEPGIIKVGTSSESRKRIRLIEQDALVYAFIARSSSGFLIAPLERMISKTLNLTETVRAAQKFKFLSVKPDAELAGKQITKVYQEVISALGNDETFKDYFLKADQVHIEDLSSRPEIFYPKTQPLTSGTELNLFGKFSGVRGKYLIIESGGKLIAFNHKFLTGRNAEVIMEYKYDLKEAPKPAQLGMF
jgi:hypothetical protein